MIEAMAKIAEAVQETAANIENCKISIGVIEDMKNIISEIGNHVSESEKTYASNNIDDISGATEAQLDPRSTYCKNGHVYETDDRGHPYKMDGELIPEVEFTSNGGKYRVDARGNIETLKEGYQSSYEERFNRTPVNGERGSWTGDRAESGYRPNAETEKGAKAAEKLSTYELEEIEYEDALPNFDKCTEESVEIDMTENRISNRSNGIIGNFEKADTECARKWNADGKDGKTNWTARDVEKYRRDHNMTWHECPDRKTCQMISRDIHDYYGHSGGVFECKKITGHDFGGGFDA